MQEPTPRKSRLTLAAAVVAVIVVGGGGFLLGRETVERPKTVVAPPVVAPVAVPDPEPVILGRAELIEFAAKAANAAASRQPASAAVAEAEGRRFALRLPFGCAGPAAADSEAPMRWRYDREAQALRFSVSPVVWTAADWWAETPPPAIEAIMGFWIMRPWTSSEQCPRSATANIGAEPVTLPGQTLALGQIFRGDEASRSRRAGQNYETVVRIAPEAFDAAAGFRLRINGRIAATRSDGPVRCKQPAGSEQRPICLIAVDMAEVAIENPADGETLAVWTIDQGDAAR